MWQISLFNESPLCYALHGTQTSQTALKGVDELQHADDKRSHVNMETVSPTAYIFRLEIVVLYVILYSRERIIRMKQQWCVLMGFRGKSLSVVLKAFPNGTLPSQQTIITVP